MQVPSPLDTANARSGEGAAGTSADFDPYFKWLGIPPEEQPPNHYRLLAIPLFTCDPEVIENAADQRMAHLKTVQTGQHAAHSQRLLDQIAQARVCLLDQNRRAAYDLWLSSFQVPPIVPPPVTFAVHSPNLDQEEIETSSIRSNRSRKANSPTVELLKIVFGGLVGLAIGYLFLLWISPNNDFLGIFTESKNTAENRPQLSPVDTIPENAEPAIKETNSSVEDRQPKPKVAQTSTPTMEPSPDAVPDDLTQTKAKLEAERDDAIRRGDLAESLQGVAELASLEGTNVLEGQLSLLSTWETDSRTSLREVAGYTVNLLEKAVAENKFDLSARHVDRLLSLARTLDDRELERRATLIALKRPTAPSDSPSMPVETTKARPTANPTPPVSDAIEQLLTVIPKSEATIRDSQGQLISLHCGGVVLTEKQLADIGKVETLRALYLPLTKLNDAGLEKLSGLSSLTHLGIWNTDVTSDGMRHVAKLAKLNTLSVEGNAKVGDEGVAHLLELKDLSDLGLSWTGVTDDGLRHLNELPSLKSLALNHTNITDQGMEYLLRIKTLTHVALAETKVTDVGVARLKAALPDCEVIRTKP